MDASGTQVPQSPGSPMHVDLASVDLEMLAHALSDQGIDGEWLFDPGTGETGFWQRDIGVDVGDDEDDDLDDDQDDDRDAGRLIEVEALPSSVWYRDMADFAELVSDAATARRLGRALDGRGAFRRFGDEVHRASPELVTAWRTFKDLRAGRRAVEWLRDNDLVSAQTYDRFVVEHPDPPVP